MPRLRLTSIALAASALALAGCTGDADPAPSATAASTATAVTSPESTATATDGVTTAEPTASSTSTPEPSETATADPGWTDVASRDGLIAGAVPPEWTACDDADARATSIALDVLGAWAADGGCADGTVAVVEALPAPQGGVTAEVYLTQVLEPQAADAGLTLESETFRTGAGDEALLAVREGDDSAVFVVFMGEMLVRGTLAGPSVDGAVEDLRGVAASIAVG